MRMPLELPPRDFALSPHTGLTRAHWAHVADELLLALRPYFSAGGARVADAFECDRESWLQQALPARRRLATGQKCAPRCGMLFELFARPTDGARLPFAQDRAVARERDGSFQQRGPGQPSVAFMRKVEARDRARHTDRARRFCALGDEA